MPDFQTLFGSLPQAAGSAPGRVNLIGEHTDYNGGYVLPVAIPQCTLVELTPRADSATVRVWSSARSKGGDIRVFQMGRESPARDWMDYVQGATQILAREGHRLGGFDARIESHVPLGSGLSSSASLTVALMRALREGFSLNLDDVQIAQLGQRIENEFVGARVGIMDPMAASLADEHTALFLDARSLACERVTLPTDAELIVIHSGISHRLTTGDYNTRRAECEKACTLLNVNQLRDLGLADLSRVEALADPLDRRARHVITENDRVLAAVAALRAGDLSRLGELFYQSHDSMRDDYQVSVPEIDLMVELARGDKNIYGARLTGGGFGGSVVMLARMGKALETAERIARDYKERTGCRPSTLVPAVGRFSDCTPLPEP
jgi:galactokinase